MKYLILLLLICFGCEAPLSEEDMNRRLHREEVILDIDERPRDRVPVTVAEPRVGEWTNSPTWGSGYSGLMPDSAGREIPVFSLDRTYGPPTVHTINLFASANIGGTNSDVRARVRFGTGAVQNEFVADWVNGQQFNLVADHIRITAITFAPIMGQVYSPVNGAIQLTACLAKGAGGTNAPLTYTEGRLTMAPTATHDFAAPAMAKAVVVHVDGNNNPSITTDVLLYFLLAPEGYVGPLPPVTLAQYDAQIMAGGQQATVIPAGTQMLRVVNNSVSNQNVNVQWILGI